MAATKLWGRRSDVSLNEIAEAAGVSRATLDHHYPSATDLREAINEHVMSTAARYFADAPVEDDLDYSRFGRRITNLLKENADEVRYVARGAIDGDADGLAMFDAFMAIGLQNYQDLADNGVLAPETDVDWAAIHMVVFNLSAMLFEHAIDNHLPEPLSSDAGMERWHLADTELFRHGHLKPDTRWRPVTT